LGGGVCRVGQERRLLAPGGPRAHQHVCSAITHAYAVCTALAYHESVSVNRNGNAELAAATGELGLLLPAGAVVDEYVCGSRTASASDAIEIHDVVIVLMVARADHERRPVECDVKAVAVAVVHVETQADIQPGVLYLCTPGASRARVDVGGSSIVVRHGGGDGQEISGGCNPVRERVALYAVRRGQLGLLDEGGSVTARSDEQETH